MPTTAATMARGTPKRYKLAVGRQERRPAMSLACSFMTRPPEKYNELERVLARARPVLRWRYAILSAAALTFALQHLRGTGKDWYFFTLGSELLFGQHHRYSSLAGGLHLYANYPQIQIGPLS